MAAARRERRSPLKRAASWVRNATFLPYELYSCCDRRLYRCEPDPFEASSIRELLHGAEVVPVSPRQTAFSDYFADEVVDRLLALKLDVALRFGFRILRGRALGVASLGRWSFHHGDNTESRGGPTCFCEVFEGRETAGAVLQVLSEELDAGQVLAWVHVPTHALSAIQTAGRLHDRAIPALIFCARTFALGHRSDPTQHVGERGACLCATAVHAPASCVHDPVCRPLGCEADQRVVASDGGPRTMAAHGASRPQLAVRRADRRAVSFPTSGATCGPILCRPLPCVARGTSLAVLRRASVCQCECPYLGRGSERARRVGQRPYERPSPRLPLVLSLRLPLGW